MDELSPKFHSVLVTSPVVVLVKAVIWPSQSGELEVKLVAGVPLMNTVALAECEPAALVAVRITVKVPVVA